MRLSWERGDKTGRERKVVRGNTHSEKTASGRKQKERQGGVSPPNEKKRVFCCLVGNGM